MEVKRSRMIEMEKKAVELYTKLKSTDQGSKVDYDVQSYLMNCLKIRQGVPIALMGIIELLRINAPDNVLTENEEKIFFTMLIETIPNEKINLESFITYRIPSILSNKRLILKFANLISVVKGVTMQYMKEILTIFIEENDIEIQKNIIKTVLINLPKDESLNIIFENTKNISSQIIQLLMEDFDDKTYADVYSALEKKDFLTPKNIKGIGKIKYLKSAMSKKNFETLCSFYIGDRDKRVTEILAKNCDPSHVNIFNRLITDPNDNVRIAVLENIKYEDLINYNLDVSERFLDSNNSVGTLIYNIYLSSLKFYKENLAFDFENYDEEQENKKKPSSLNSKNRKSHLNVFLKLTKTLFKGVLTKEAKRYLQYIETCEFTPDFIFKIKEYPGVSEYLNVKSSEGKNIKMTLEQINLTQNIDKKRFYLKYFAAENNSMEEVKKLISQDILSALAYLENKKCQEFKKELMDAAKSQPIDIVLKIVKLIKPYLINEEFICDNMSNNELIIYAHSSCALNYIEQVCKMIPSFCTLYFLCNSQAPLETINSLLKQLELTTEEYISLFLSYNNYKVLENYVDYFINCKPSKDLLKQLVENRSGVGTLIYFLITGKIKIRNPDFFISSLVLICNNTTNIQKVINIYETYVMSIDNQTFDVFYSIVKKLKTMSFNAEPHKIAEGKVVLQNNDRILYSVCDILLNSGKGNVVEENYNLAKFHSIPDNIIELIKMGHYV